MNSQTLNISLSLGGDELLSHLLGTFQGDFEDRSDQYTLNQLIRTHVRSGTSRLPNAVLQQLEDFEPKADQLLPIQRTIQIATLLLGANEETMRLFLTSNIVTTVLALLDGVLRLPLKTTSSQEHRLEVCTACLMFIYSTMRCSNGLPWLVEAFDNDFMSILLKLTDKLKRTRGLGNLVDGLNTIIGELIGTLTEYMSYYSVITALSTIQGRQNAARIVRAQESGPLKDKWVALFNLIIERSATQGLLSARIRNVPVRCDNAECNTEVRRGDMLKCAGCLYTFYCSQPCQRRAWTHGNHKARCNAPETTEGFVTWGARDIEFLPVLCHTWIFNNLISLSIQAREKFPRLPTQEIAFSVDFRVQPPKVKILHLDEVIRIFPQASNTIRATAAAKQIICLPSLARYPGLPSSSLMCSPIQRLSPVECEVFYNLLEAYRQPTMDSRKRKECLEIAKRCCRSSEIVTNEVRSDFHSFLVDSSRRKWSASNAKDIVCRGFDIAGMDWSFIDSTY